MESRPPSGTSDEIAGHPTEDRAADEDPDEPWMAVVTKNRIGTGSAFCNTKTINPTMITSAKMLFAKRT